jgi:hypothetical protein
MYHSHVPQPKSWPSHIQVHHELVMFNKHEVEHVQLFHHPADLLAFSICSKALVNYSVGLAGQHHVASRQGLSLQCRVC